MLAVTDLHVDYEENMRWCEALPPRRRDVLVVSGDASDELAGGCCLPACFYFSHLCACCLMLPDAAPGPPKGGRGCRPGCERCPPARPAPRCAR